MKWVLILAAFTFAARGDVGGYQLIPREGESAPRPGSVVVELPIDKAKTAAQSPAQSLNALLPQIVNKAEAVFRRGIPKNATDAQREESDRKNQEQLTESLSPLIGSRVSASFTVLNVVRRDGDAGKYLVTGKMSWQSPPVNSDDQRKAIADARKENQEALKQLADEHQRQLRATNDATSRRTMDSSG